MQRISINVEAGNFTDCHSMHESRSIFNIVNRHMLHPKQQASR